MKTTTFVPSSLSTTSAFTESFSKTTMQPNKPTYQNPQNTKRSISEQLKGILHRLDGEDHVNVDRTAKTRIGSIAAMDKNSKFFVPYLGDFRTPRAFAWWMVTNNDVHRSSPPVGPIRELSNVEYHDLLLFAKFFHLCSWQSVIKQEAALLEKPWTSYHVLPGSALKQYNNWKSYPDIVRDMCEYIATADLSVSPCENFTPAIMEAVNNLLKVKAESLGVEFLPYEKMEEEAKKAAKANKARRTQNNDDQPHNARGFNSVPSQPAQPRPPKQKYKSRYGEPVPQSVIDPSGLPADNPEDLAAVGEVKSVYQASSAPKQVEEVDRGLTKHMNHVDEVCDAQAAVSATAEVLVATTEVEIATENTQVSVSETPAAPETTAVCETVESQS